MGTVSEERKAETRDMILQAARKIFSQRGYHKTQIADIVREAGISTGSIYAHFKDKRDLFAVVSRENLESLRARLRQLRQTERPDDNIRDRIERWRYTYGAFFDYVYENPQQLLMILRGGFGVDEEHDTDLWEYFNSFAEDIADDFRKWERLGYIKGINASLLGHIVIGMCLQVAHSFLANGSFTRKEAINNLMALNHSMFSIYLTDKGRAELGDLSVPQIFEG
jgi:AcrR family transcriptional regulator